MAIKTILGFLFIGGIISAFLLWWQPGSSDAVSKATVHEVQNSADTHEPLCLVYCDFTSSLDSNSKQKVIHDALVIFDSLSRRKKIRFFLISDRFSNCFFTNTTFNLRSYKPSQLKAFKLKNAKERDSLSTLLTSYAKSKSVKGSCIINCIDQSIREFSNYDGNGEANFSLYILSDMLEYCNSSFGKINLELQTPENYDKSLTLIDRISPPLSFRHLKNLRIYPVMSTEQVSQVNKHDEFWNRLFKKYGFEKLPHLSSTLPVFSNN